MKNLKSLLLILLTLSSTLAFASSPTIRLWGGGMFGLSIGSILAVYLSWKRNKSILWAIIHFIFGWLYVIYNLLTKK
ncbi:MULTISPECIES: hypothetical protein [Myroides]|uniref:CPBP family intramembrane metalloprotease n=1 Tax=Myroides albus TaxID=2562892 RepID=A0A6I3LIM7_9FLAO|nr:MULTISPECIES: hypothetical protein [Myroides]MTG97674.1 hypothetical protein [Myroides albus]MVX35673.1 hypothetical protein [Myroides sp. LoEW2-1]UVD78780.1 hypothetical protein NWE55_11700 [Myroides albus]